MTEQVPLIIIGSARQKGDTRSCVDFVFNQTDHKVLDLLEQNISTYNYTGDYPSTDNFKEVTEEILNHDVIVFATPVYWYSMSSLMKNLFDRFTDLVTIQKTTGRKLKNKTVFLLAVGTDPILPDGFEIPFKLTAKYLDMNYKGYLYFSSDDLTLNGEKSQHRQEFINLIKAHTAHNK